MAGGCIVERVDENLTYDYLHASEDNLWSTLYLTGYGHACRHSSHIERHPARERKLILLRYGLAGQPPLTQLETAQLLQISRSYVSRLETHALEQLRKGWLQESPGE